MQARSFFKLPSINDSTLHPNSMTKSVLQLQALRAPTIQLDGSSVEDACTVGELASSVYETLSSMPDVTCRPKSHSLPLHQHHHQTITANHQRATLTVQCNRNCLLVATPSYSRAMRMRRLYAIRLRQWVVIRHFLLLYVIALLIDRRWSVFISRVLIS